MAAARLAGSPDLKIPDPTNKPSTPSCIMRAASAGVANLLSNAVKYSPEETEISVQCESNKQELIVRVHDQGIGISHQELGKVFERFYQAASGQSHKGGGVGLGLAICKGIIDAHGGRIWAESELGKGSIFTFTLPLSPQETKSSG